ncbi:MAG: hypothetical protein WCK09_04240 [Bacteroidota bacterium]
MTTNEIEVLLERFFEGNTSLREEKVLRDFFNGQSVPDHLKLYQPLFTYFKEEVLEDIQDHDFEQKLTSLITELPFDAPVVRKLPARRSFMFISSIAAGILLLIGLFFTIKNDVFKGKLTQTEQSAPEIAYAEASEALMMVSGNLNQGLKHVERLKMVDKAMNNMQRFNKFYQVQSIIINPDEMTNQSIKSK